MFRYMITRYSTFDDNNPEMERLSHEGWFIHTAQFISDGNVLWILWEYKPYDPKYSST
jgi:hypothetical protein